MSSQTTSSCRDAPGFWFWGTWAWHRPVSHSRESSRRRSCTSSYKGAEELHVRGGSLGVIGGASASDAWCYPGEWRTGVPAEMQADGWHAMTAAAVLSPADGGGRGNVSTAARHPRAARTTARRVRADADGWRQGCGELRTAPSSCVARRPPSMAQHGPAFVHHGPAPEVVARPLALLCCPSDIPAPSLHPSAAAAAACPP